MINPEENAPVKSWRFVLNLRLKPDLKAPESDRGLSDRDTAEGVEEDAQHALSDYGATLEDATEWIPHRVQVRRGSRLCLSCEMTISAATYDQAWQAVNDFAFFVPGQEIVTFHAEPIA